MPYDAPMSLEEALQDPETRRRALAMVGMDDPVPPIGSGTGNWFPEPTGTTGTAPDAAPPTDDLVSRYLAAQGADRRQQRINDLNEGFGNAAQTILGTAGVPYARGRSAQPRAAADVLDLERVRAAAMKPSAIGGRAPGMTDAQAQSVVRERYPGASERLIQNTTAGNFEEVMKDLRSKAGIDERTGAMTRREEMEKERLRQMATQGDLNRSVQWARLRQDAEEGGATRGFRRWLFEQEEDAKEKERADKRQDKADAVSVPDAEIAPGAKPTPQDAEKVKAILAAEKALNTGIARMRDLNRTYGTEKGGKGDLLINQALTGLSLEAKTIADLGALSGPDQGLMESLAGDNPTTAWANVKGFFGVDNTQAAMDGLETWMKGKVAATLEARGYRKKAPGTATAQKRTPISDTLPPDADGNPTLDTGGRIKVRNKKTGEAKWLAPDDAYKLLAKPDKYDRG